MEILEEDEVHDVIDVRVDADIGPGGVEVLAEAGQGRSVDLPALRLEQRGDLLELPAAGPRAMDADEEGLFSGRRRLSGRRGNQADKTEEDEENADFQGEMIG